MFSTVTNTSRSALYQHVDRHIGQHSVDILTNTSVDCRSICQQMYRSRGAQNTDDPVFFLVMVNVINFGLFKFSVVNLEKGLLRYPI